MKIKTKQSKSHETKQIEQICFLLCTILKFWQHLQMVARAY